MNFVVHPGAHRRIVHQAQQAEHPAGEQVARYRYIYNTRVQEGFFEGGELLAGERIIEYKEQAGGGASRSGLSGISGSGKIAKGLLNGISKAFDTLAGQARYDGWELDTHLDLNVDAEANIDMSDAEQAVKERMETWEEELKGYGLTAGEIASLLAFSGTEEELVKFLADEYPDLKADAKEAVIRNFRMESYRKATVAALQSVGIIDPDFIADILYKKASGDELREYFAKILPNFDRDRVQNSHIKKLIQWYNILIENGISEFKDAEAETAEEAKEA